MQNFGVDTDALREPVSTRVFRAWVEDWEVELLKMNDCVAEAKLLEKYKDLVFYDPDTQVILLCMQIIWNSIEEQMGSGT